MTSSVRGNSLETTSSTIGSSPSMRPPKVPIIQDPGLANPLEMPRIHSSPPKRIYQAFPSSVPNAAIAGLRPIANGVNATPRVGNSVGTNTSPEVSSSSTRATQTPLQNRASPVGRMVGAAAGVALVGMQIVGLGNQLHAANIARREAELYEASMARTTAYVDQTIADNHFGGHAISQDLMEDFTSMSTPSFSSNLSPGQALFAGLNPPVNQAAGKVGRGNVRVPSQGSGGGAGGTQAVGRGAVGQVQQRPMEDGDGGDQSPRPNKGGPGKKEEVEAQPIPPLKAKSVDEKPKDERPWSVRAAETHSKIPKQPKSSPPPAPPAEEPAWMEQIVHTEVKPTVYDRDGGSSNTAYIFLRGGREIHVHVEWEMLKGGEYNFKRSVGNLYQRIKGKPPRKEFKGEINNAEFPKALQKGRDLVEQDFYEKLRNPR